MLVPWNEKTNTYFITIVEVTISYSKVGALQVYTYNIIKLQFGPCSIYYIDYGIPTSIAFS